jgi:hypothetical protein
MKELKKTRILLAEAWEWFVRRGCIILYIETKNQTKTSLLQCPSMYSSAKQICLLFYLFPSEKKLPVKFIFWFMTHHSLLWTKPPLSPPYNSNLSIETVLTEIRYWLDSAALDWIQRRTNSTPISEVLGFRRSCPFIYTIQLCLEVKRDQLQKHANYSLNYVK